MWVYISIIYQICNRIYILFFLFSFYFYNELDYDIRGKSYQMVLIYQKIGYIIYIYIQVITFNTYIDIFINIYIAVYIFSNINHVQPTLRHCGWECRNAFVCLLLIHIFFLLYIFIYSILDFFIITTSKHQIKCMKRHCLKSMLMMIMKDATLSIQSRKKMHTYGWIWMLFTNDYMEVEHKKIGKKIITTLRIQEGNMLYMLTLFYILIEKYIF